MKMRKIILSVLIIIVLLAAAMFIYLSQPGAAPQAQAQAYMQSSAEVMVTIDKWITFTPTGSTPTVGFIFYPGGKVDEQAYSPVLNAIAAEGFLVVIAPMPFDLAVFGTNRAEEVIKAHPEINTWVIGGHSLGGVMAAQFSAGHLNLVDGLALWASYPSEGTSLAETNLAVISIYGTLDGLSTPEDIDASIPLLPADTIWAPIEGGNHAQFGDYGAQNGDLTASISAEEQQSQIVSLMVEFLSSLTP